MRASNEGPTQFSPTRPRGAERPRLSTCRALREQETDRVVLLPLPLLVPRICAEDSDNASPPDHFTFGANRLNRRFDLHNRPRSYLNRYVMRPLVRS